MIPRSLSSAIVVLVSVVWGLNFFVQFFAPSYHPDVTLNGVFMAIVGGALALSRPGSGQGKKSHHQDDDQ